VFALVSGTNDGGVLVGLATRTGALTPSAAVLTLSAAVAVGPWVTGTGVARTVAHRLVAFEGGGGRLALMLAALAALAVVFALSRLGLPTSLTLALAGGIIGEGLGEGLRADWATVAQVLAVGLVAPLAAVVAGSATVRLLALVPAAALRGGTGRQVQRLGFLAQCAAYSSNDAQKMVAMIAVATQAASQPVELHWAGQAGIAVCFALGTLLGVRPVAARIGEQMLTVRRSSAVALEFAASAAVFASTALGVPVSSTQAATTALVGTGVGSNRHRVRWHEVRNVGAAWALTLPAAACLGAALGAGLRVLR
jgi:PiT family inorganic phosphate transporter